MPIILTSFFLTFILLKGYLKSPFSNFALDKPNARSLHVHHTPRTGGVAVIISVVVAWTITRVDYLWFILVLGLVVPSLIDDIRGLKVRWRLLAQLSLSVFFAWLFLPHLSWYTLFLAVLALVWMTNLYNFMDGSDGLAGGMAVFGFGVYALAAYSLGDIKLALMCASISASCLAFLMFNFYPAKIFMGDAGSIPLGFLAGAIGLQGWHLELWPLWFPLLVFSPFIVDATVTLLKRALRHERIWQAHREHYYQRLIQMGWGHKKTAIAEYLLMFSVSASALLVIRLANLSVMALFSFWLLVYCIILLKIDKNWKQRSSSYSN
ncbi:MAG: MraY family glycosyltransferase [Methylophilaceae bacterium]